MYCGLLLKPRAVRVGVGEGGPRAVRVGVGEDQGQLGWERGREDQGWLGWEWQGRLPKCLRLDFMAK